MTGPKNLLLLKVGMIVPVLYFGTVLAAWMFTPDFQILHQVSSALGSDQGPHPQIFNTGFVLFGASTIAAAFGFRQALRLLNAAPLYSWIVSIILAAFGLGSLLAGFFHYPDSRHQAAASLGLGLIIAPLVLVRSIWAIAGFRGFRLYLVITNVLMLAAMAVYCFNMSSENIGGFQLLYSLVALPWIGVSAFVLSRALGSMPET